MMSKQERKEYMKAWREAHKESEKAKMKAWHEAHKDSEKAKIKAWKQSHKESINAYTKSELNSLGKTKNSIRYKSRRILKTSGINIPGYENHHCFGYEDPSKFIYISKSLHLKIHKFLRDNNIDADSNHYEQIKHLLDEKVFLFK